MERDDLAYREWDAWRRICAMLERLGAVTSEDLNRPVSATATTDGAELLNLLRSWGNLREEQGLLS